ncbi:arabinogalactan protein 23 [Lathyrus oleraceus]|uniref:arabinogalactan protein 23 n=1 Tax=Pisum sativum TaxID=3888 RepID=UPI0021CECA04|nr:arabinogalactan protein 23-like [Pisum sativum]
MNMKKVTCAVLFVAASMSAAMAAVEVPAAAPAPGPSSDASASIPIVGSLVGATLVSFFALFH